MPVIIDTGTGDGSGGGGGNPPLLLPDSWILINTSQTLSWEEANGDPIFSAFQMKFNTMTNSYGSYPSYKMKYFINKDYMKLSGTSVDGILQEISITPDGVSQSFLPEFIAGNTLTGGTHSIYITMRLYGISGGSEYFLDEKTHSITLNYSQDLNLVKLQKLKYNIAFVKSTGLLYGDKNMVISVNPSSEVCSVVFNQSTAYLATTPATSATGFTIVEGANVLDLQNMPTPYSLSGKLVDSGGALITNFIVDIEILDNEDIVTFPKSFDFILVKSNANTVTAPLQLLNIANTSYTITLPSWLTSSISGGSSSADIILTTVNGSTLLAGEYNDQLSINYASKTLNIPVNLTVIEFITSEFQPNDYNFCLDKKLIKFYRQSAEGVFIKIILDVLFKIEGQFRTVRIPLNSVYFQDRCDFDIGEVVNNYFLKFRKSLLQNSTPGNFLAKVVYYPAEVTMEAQELDENYNVLTTSSLADVKLYAGKTPKGFPFLTNHLVRSRVEGSKQIISYISNLVDAEDIADNFTIASALPQKAVASVMLSEENMLVFWPAAKVFTKAWKKLKIITRKSGNTTINIQWENQNLAPEYFSCSGDFIFSKDKVHTVDNSLRNSKSQKFKTENVQKLTVDTGFILKSEIPVIDDLADALHCILEIGGNYYEGYCNSTKVMGESSTEELINYNLEFIVEKYEN